MIKKLTAKFIFLFLFSLISAVFFCGCNSFSTSGKLKIIFVVDGKTNFTVYANSNETISEPQKPELPGYEFQGWFNEDQLFDFNTPVNSNLTLEANWTAVIYKVKFITDGVLVEECSYTVEDKNITIPQVPKKQYYSGNWENFELTYGDLEVNSIYTPLIYTTAFMVDGNIYKETEHTALNTDIVIPEVPEKSGYDGSWSRLPALFENITISAIYTPIEYTIQFVAGGESYSINYTVENREQLSPPPIPERNGYTAEWEDFELDLGDITVNAEYNLINYKVEFIADDVVVSTQYFNIEDMRRIIEPTIPPKDGYSAEWEDYTITLDDIKIYAVYTPI